MKPHEIVPAIFTEFVTPYGEPELVRSAVKITRGHLRTCADVEVEFMEWIGEHPLHKTSSLEFVEEGVKLHSGDYVIDNHHMVFEALVESTREGELFDPSSPEGLAIARVIMRFTEMSQGVERNKEFPLPPETPTS